jgi:hypothetical protein
MFGTKGLAAGRPHLQAPPARPARDSLRFDVSWKQIPSALAAVFFAACAFVLWLMMLDPRGVVIDHLITLGPRGANIFFGLLVLAAIGMSAAGAANFVRSFGEPRWLTLGPDGVRGPKNAVSRQEVSIAYRAIRQARVLKVQRQQIVQIVGDGKAIKLPAATFRSSGEFARFVEELRARIG